jgi:hypothetical protein
VSLERGSLVAGVSGGVLFLVMFLSWFNLTESASAVAAGIDTTDNAWQAFDLIDLVLFATAIAAVGIAVLPLMGLRIDMPVASAVVAGLGLLSTLLVFYRIVNPPLDAGREVGVFLGLISAAGVTVGGWLAMQEQGLARGSRARFGDRAPPPPPPPTGP